MDSFGTAGGSPSHRDRRASGPPGPPGPTGAAGAAASPSWGPAPWLSSLTVLGMLGALAWRFVDNDPENRVVATVLAIVCAVVTLVLVRVRIRLRVVDGGIAVTGPLHTRRIDWTQISSISTPQRGRFGRRAALLEVEVRPDHGGDPAGAAGTDPEGDELLAFGRFDLGADPLGVGRELLRLRARSLGS